MDGFSNYVIDEHSSLSLPTNMKHLDRPKELDFVGTQLPAEDGFVSQLKSDLYRRRYGFPAQRSINFANVNRSGK
jgi:hypothetical protein